MRFSPLCSGSSGNSSFFESGDTRLLIDAGVTGKKAEALLSEIQVDPATITGILVTHEHTDHIQGVGILSRRYGIPVYANAECFAQMLPVIGNIPAKLMRIFESDHDFFIQNIRVFPFSTPHDAAHSVGYTLSCAGNRVSIMTDIGYTDTRMLDAVAGSDILLLESNHDPDMLKAGPYPQHLKTRILGRKGHLSNEDAGKALVFLHQKGIRNVVLGHLSSENNTPDLALVTVRTILEEAGCLSDMFLTVAKRDTPTCVFQL
jgi:phosphoribosyl 1,2-cyclic phosphodiesterase